MGIDISIIGSRIRIKNDQTWSISYFLSDVKDFSFKEDNFLYMKIADDTETPISSEGFLKIPFAGLTINSVAPADVAAAQAAIDAFFVSPSAVPALFLLGSFSGTVSNDNEYTLDFASGKSLENSIPIFVTYQHNQDPSSFDVQLRTSVNDNRISSDGSTELGNTIVQYITNKNPDIGTNAGNLILYVASIPGEEPTINVFVYGISRT